MTGLEIFAFIILPLTIAAVGGTIGYIYGYKGNDHIHPGE